MSTHRAWRSLVEGARVMAVLLLGLALASGACARRPEAGPPVGTLADVGAERGGGDTTAGATAGAVMARAQGPAGGAANGAGAAGAASFGSAERPAPKDFEAIEELRDIHFDFDRADIRSDAAAILARSAEWLRAHPGYLVLIEGHTDERGTEEYNLALGDRRARAARNYLVAHGVTASRLSLVSYGELRGVCGDEHERCWRQNRRAHFGAKRG